MQAKRVLFACLNNRKLLHHLDQPHRRSCLNRPRKSNVHNAMDTFFVAVAAVKQNEKKIK